MQMKCFKKIYMQVKIKFKNDEVKELYLKASKKKSTVPFKTYDGDFCYDVVAVSCEEIAPNVYKYDLGIALEIVRDHMSYTVPFNGISKAVDLRELDIRLSIDIRPRSSVWKTGLSLCNCEGTGDEPYRGWYSAIFYHVCPNMPKYEVGDRIGQMKIGFTVPIEFIETDELSDTERGCGGFGSTGQ